MRLLKGLIFIFVLFLAFPIVVFAHDTGMVHEEAVPTISPMILIWIVLGLGVGGFLLWKFVLHSHKSSPPTQSTPSEKTQPTQEKTVSQSGEDKSS